MVIRTVAVMTMSTVLVCSAVVTREQGLALARSEGLEFFETSAAQAPQNLYPPPPSTLLRNPALLACPAVRLSVGSPQVTCHALLTTAHGTQQLNNEDPFHFIADQFHKYVRRPLFQILKSIELADHMPVAFLSWDPFQRCLTSLTRCSVSEL